MRYLKLVIAVITVIGLAGCSGSRIARRPGAMKLIERTPEKKPRWVGRAESHWQKKGKFMFVGAVKDRADFALSIREAMIEGTKVCAEQISRSLSLSLQSSVAGQNVADDLGRQIRDLFIQESKNLKIMGLVQRERFVETWDVGTVGGQRRVHHAWVLMAISEEDYLASKQDLLDRAAGRARESRDAQAQKLLDEFRAEVKQEARRP